MTQLVPPTRTGAQRARPWWPAETGNAPCVGGCGRAAVPGGGNSGSACRFCVQHAQREAGKSGWIYLVGSSVPGIMKIGFTVDLQNRLRSLQTGSPVLLELIQSWPGWAADEKDLHRHFAARRAHGEHFLFDAADAAVTVERALLEHVRREHGCEEHPEGCRLPPRPERHPQISIRREPVMQPARHPVVLPWKPTLSQMAERIFASQGLTTGLSR